MSLLKAMDELLETRRLIHDLRVEMEEIKLDEIAQNGLLEAWEAVWNMINRTVQDAEAALLPDGLKVAVSFMPLSREDSTRNSESGIGGRMPRRGGDPRGTLLLPSEAPGNSRSESGA
jgi:hypothetical protein